MASSADTKASCSVTWRSGCATDAEMTYGGEAEAEDGKADVIDVKTGSGTPMRVFFDQETHLPLMLTYEGPQPRMMVRGLAGPQAARQGRRRPRRDAPADGASRRRWSRSRCVSRTSRT